MNRPLAAYSLFAGGVATVSGLVATVILPFHGLTFWGSWFVDTVSCAVPLGLAYVLASAWLKRHPDDESSER